MSNVWVDMNTQKSTHMTVKQAAAHHNVAEKTIRRWIDNGKLSAEKVNGHWRVYPSPDTCPDNDQTHDQADVQPNGQIQQMQSEINYLRELLDRRDNEIERRDNEIERQSTILAMMTKENNTLTDKLKAPRTTIRARFNQLLTKLTA